LGTGPVLRTARLDLRELTPDDFDAVHAYASDPEVVRFMQWGPNTEQDTFDFIERAIAHAEDEGRTMYELAVVVRGEDRLIGAIGLEVDEVDARGTLGYCLHRGAWGHGYATEAARAVTAFGFEVLLLHRIRAGCDPENAASARVLEKVGMTLEGHLRENVRVRGAFRDTLVFGMLRREWTARESAS